MMSATRWRRQVAQIVLDPVGCADDPFRGRKISSCNSSPAPSRLGGDDLRYLDRGQPQGSCRGRQADVTHQAQDSCARHPGPDEGRGSAENCPDEHSRAATDEGDESAGGSGPHGGAGLAPKAERSGREPHRENQTA